MNVQLTSQAALSWSRPLAGKIALVTGSTSGIGLGVARALAQAGSAIVLNGFGNAAEIERTKEQISAACGVEADYSPADMTKSEAIGKMIAATLDKHGRLDVLVNSGWTAH